ncbi:MAG: teichoic acid biosynthesis protein C, partial [Myxococcales bacterium]
MQSFAVDQKNGRMYFAQLKDGGSGDDLCITETTMAGNETGHMYLDNAGHGVSIGVESVGKDSYLWVETDSHKNDDSGRGTALLRFKFQDGKKPSGKKFLTGSHTITAATD